MSLSSSRFRSSAAKLVQLALAAIQVLLPPREILDAIERIVIRLPLLRALLDLRALLVVGPLLALQLLVEERGQILARAIAAAAAGAAGLLHHLAAADFRLRLQQPVQRGHFMRDRVARALRAELLDGACHRFDGCRDALTGAWPRRLRLRPDPLRDRLSRNRRPRELAARRSARAFSSACALAMASMSSLERPPSDRRSMFQVALMISFCAADQAVELRIAGRPPPAWLCAATNSSLNGLTSRKNMSLLVSVDRFAAPHVARPRVIR